MNAGLPDTISEIIRRVTVEAYDKGYERGRDIGYREGHLAAMASVYKRTSPKDEEVA